MKKMQAIIRENGETTLSEIPVPVISKEDDVLVKVEIAALCRTDVKVALGLINESERLVLGHEFSGVVEEIGDGVQGVEVGDRVAVMPVMPCGECCSCELKKYSRCEEPTMLGVHHDGAFAQYVVVPASTLNLIPDSLSFTMAAYSEPVAASLAVLKAGIKPNQKGVIYGNNRIAKLTLKIMEVEGFRHIQLYDPTGEEQIPRSSLDFAIETLATTESLNRLVEFVKPGGTIILKSRQHVPVEINVNTLVMRELIMAGVNYGSFSHAVELLAGGELDLTSLIGSTYPLSEYKNVFAGALESEERKRFFAPWV